MSLLERRRQLFINKDSEPIALFDVESDEKIGVSDWAGKNVTISEDGIISTSRYSWAYYPHKIVAKVPYTLQVNIAPTTAVGRQYLCVTDNISPWAIATGVDATKFAYYNGTSNDWYNWWLYAGKKTINFTNFKENYNFSGELNTLNANGEWVGYENNVYEKRQEALVLYGMVDSNTAGRYKITKITLFPYTIIS